MKDADFTARLVGYGEACRREGELDAPLTPAMFDCPWGIAPEIYEEMASSVVGLRQLEDGIQMKDGIHKVYEIVGGDYEGFMVPDIFIKEIVTGEVKDSEN